jgi:predicted P-loop ATPase
MPTTKPRYTFTDTGEVRELLDQAQRHWPGVHDRKELLLRLAGAGRDAIERQVADRRNAVAETAGALSGVYEPGELERLREDWPA